MAILLASDVRRIKRKESFDKLLGPGLSNVPGWTERYNKALEQVQQEYSLSLTRHWKHWLTLTPEEQEYTLKRVENIQKLIKERFYNI